MRADDVRVVRMALRKERVKHRLFDDAVRLVLDALAPLVSHDVLLIGEAGLIDDVEEIAHAIRLEPQRQLELVRRHRFEVVRAIEIGGAVDVAAAGAFDGLEVRVGRHVLRRLEHHVLEEMREPGAAGLLIRGADVVPQIHRHERQPMILRQDHIQAIRQREFFEVDLGDVALLGGRAGCLRNRRASCTRPLP